MVELVTAGVIVLLFAAGFLVVVPDARNSLNAIVTGPKSCEVAPYAGNCFCQLGVERKISVPWLGVPKWSCETLEDLLVDPESLTFESDSIAFAEEYLSRWCGNIWVDTCGGETCGVTIDGQWVPSGFPIYPKDKCISASWGWNAQGERISNMECIKVKTWNTPQGVLTHEEAIAIYGNQPTDGIYEKSGTIPWRMQFFVESETDTPMTRFPESNYVYNELLEKKCTHQSVCDYYAVNPSDWALAHPGWCVGDLPLNVVPTDYPMSIIGLPQLGSGFPSPTD